MSILMCSLTSSVLNAHSSINLESLMSSSWIVSFSCCWKLWYKVLLAVQKEKSFPRLSLNFLKTFSGSFLSSSDILSFCHFFNPVSPNISTILLNWRAGSTCSLASHSSALVLKLSKVDNWSGASQSCVGGGIHSLCSNVLIRWGLGPKAV